MSKKIRKLTPALLQRIIKEEKALLESLGLIKDLPANTKNKNKVNKKLLEVRAHGKKLKDLKEAQTKVALLFKKIVEEREKITRQLKKQRS